MGDDLLEYVVGEEKGLREILLDSEIVPLLKGLVKAGAAAAVVRDDGGVDLWGAADPAVAGFDLATVPIRVEGAPAGTLLVKGEPEQRELMTRLAQLLVVAIETLSRNNLKRILTTEIHTSVVNSSYEQLVEVNRSLAASEARYRELAENLETKVRERGAELKKAYAQLAQKEKLAAVGQLAAGVAHEINTPLGFITSNLHTLRKYVGRLCTMLESYRSLVSLGGSAAEIAEQAARKERELKLGPVLGDIGDLLTQSLEGAERVTAIVAGLKGFSHVDELGEQEVDLNAEIDRTLAVLAHQLGGAAQVIRELKPLPPLRCLAAPVSQIFYNIILNAVQARPEGLILTVASSCDNETIRVRIGDNGPGVPQEIRGGIFEPFFTTREVGSGSGMGLAIVYDAVNSMGGTVSVGDSPAGGAEFTMTFPLAKER